MCIADFRSPVQTGEEIVIYNSRFLCEDASFIITLVDVVDRPDFLLGHIETSVGQQQKLLGVESSSYRFGGTRINCREICRQMVLLVGNCRWQQAYCRQVVGGLQVGSIGVGFGSRRLNLITTYAKLPCFGVETLIFQTRKRLSRHYNLVIRKHLRTYNQKQSYSKTKQSYY